MLFSEIRNQKSEEKFRTKSNTMFSFIQSPVNSFIRMGSTLKAWLCCNFSRTSKLPPLIVQRFFWDQETCGSQLFFLETQMNKIKEFQIPKVTDSDLGYKIVGSCNGLICVSLYSSDPSSTLFLWNPITNQIMRIPEHPHALLPHKVSPNCLLGFSYNAIFDDFEVVRVHTSDSASWGPSLNGTCAIRVEKFSLNSLSWKEVECSNYQWVHGENYDYLKTVNGALFWVENFVSVKRKMYWVAMEVNEESSHEFIVCFDDEDKVLRKIELPISYDTEVYKRLAVYKDFLAVLINSESEIMGHYLDLWALNDDECSGPEQWIKVQTSGYFSKLDHPVGMWKDEVLMASGNLIHSTSGFKARLPSEKLGDGCSYNVFQL